MLTFLKKDALELFRTGSTLSDVNERLARMAQSALRTCAAVTALLETA